MTDDVAREQAQRLAEQEAYDERRERKAAAKQATAVADQARIEARRVRLLLDSVRLSGKRDPLVAKRDRLRFLAVVSPAFDSQRSTRTRVPGEGTQKLSRSKTHLTARLGQEIFDGLVGEGESLVIDIRPLAEEGGGPQHVTGRLRHVLSGNVTDWAGVRTLRGKFRPPGERGYAHWTATVRIDVGEATEAIDRPEPGENIDHARFAEEWERETYGPPVTAANVTRVRAQVDGLVGNISALTPPDDDVMADGATRGLFQLKRACASLRRTKNPAPYASFGYCSDVFSASPKLDSGYADLIFPLEELEHVERNTIRMFHWDRRRSAWQLVDASAAHPHHPAVWGRTRLRGIFVAVGRPKHPVIQATLDIAQRLAPIAGHSRAVGVEGSAERLCRLILCTFWGWHAGVMQGALGELEFGSLDRDLGRARAELESTVLDWRRVARLEDGATPRGDLDSSGPTEPGRQAVARAIGGPVGDIVPGHGLGDICDVCLRTPEPADLPEGPLRPFEDPWQLTAPPLVFERPPPVYGLDTCEQWSSIGPAFPSAVVRDVAFDPDNSNFIYAGTQRGGVWRSHNGGNTWVALTDHLPNLQTYAVAVARRKRPGAVHRTVYAAMIENNLGADFDLIASDNRGLDWERRAPVPGAERNETPLMLATGKDDPELLYLCTRSGLFKSTDGGRSWLTRDVTIDGVVKQNTLSLFDGVVWQVKLDPADDDTVWIAVQNRGVLMSRDGGDSWSLTTQGVALLSGSGQMRIDVGRDASRHGGDFVVASVGGTVAYTDDGGANWRVTPPAPNTQTFSGWCSAVAVCPHDERIVILGTQKAQKTDDITAATPAWSTLPDFNSWAGAGDRKNWHADIQAIEFDPNDSSRFLLATDGGLTRTNVSGTSTRRISDGIVTGQHFFMDVSQTGPFQAGASTYHTGIIKKRSTGKIWDAIGGNEGGIYRIDPLHSTHHFKSPWGGGIQRSTSAGTAGTWAKPGGFVTDDDTDYVRRLEIAPAGPPRVWAGTFFDRLFVSTNHGATFGTIKDSAGNDLLLDGQGGKRDGVECIAFSSNGRFVYVGTRNGRIWRTKTSAVNASGWSELPSLPKPPSTNATSPVTTIAVSPVSPNTIFVGYNKLGQNNVFRSTNGGHTWEPAVGALPSVALPQLPVIDLVFDAGGVNRLFAALQFGVYMTNDAAGDRWEPFSEGLPRAAAVAEMRIRRGTRTLYLATSGRGIWQRKL